MKYCNTCKTEKPYEDFHKKKAARDGLQAKCKDCVREYQQQNREHIQEYKREWCQENVDRTRETTRDWTQQNRDRKRETDRKWRQRNPEKHRTHQANRRARKRGNLTKVDLQLSAEYRKAISNDPCYYCGANEGTFHDDHFFPVGKGGTDVWFNLVRACESCNLRKNNHCGTWFLLRNPQH